MKLPVFAAILFLVPASTQAQFGKLLDVAKQAAGTATQVGIATGQPEVVALAGQVQQGAQLNDLLVQQLGVTPAQATGGAGAIFQLAQTTMPEADFAKVAAGVPNMNALLAAAPQTGTGTQGAIGAALGFLNGKHDVKSAAGLGASAVGAFAGEGSTVGAAAKLAGTFAQLDMDTTKAGMFIPIVVQYLNASAGPEVGALLQAALM